MNASVYRNTRYELRWVTHANSFMVQCSPRDQTPDIVVIDGQERLRAKRGPELELHESLFTDDEMRAIHRAEEILENAYARALDEHLAHPERSIETIEKALLAKKEHQELAAKANELRKYNAALAAEREKLEAERAQTLEAIREAAAMQQALINFELAQKRAEAQAESDRLDAELAEKKAAVEA